MLGGLHADRDLALLRCETKCALQAGCLGRPDALQRIPELREVLGLSRSEKGEVRLIVRVDARHQLDVRTIVVRQAAVPCITELVVAPRPLLLARRNVVVRNVHHAGLRAHDRIRQRSRLWWTDDHVAGRHGNVRIPAQIVRRE